MLGLKWYGPRCSAISQLVWVEGYWFGFIQSPCSRHTTFAPRSVKRLVTAAPAGPEPITSTSACSLGNGLLLAAMTVSAGSPHPALPRLPDRHLRSPRR